MGGNQMALSIVAIQTVKKRRTKIQDGKKAESARTTCAPDPGGGLNLQRSQQAEINGLFYGGLDARFLPPSGFGLSP